MSSDPHAIRNNVPRASGPALLPAQTLHKALPDWGNGTAGGAEPTETRVNSPCGIWGHALAKGRHGLTFRIMMGLADRILDLSRGQSAEA